MVGDPKQSVYKFRRADVVLYRKIRDALADARRRGPATHHQLPRAAAHTALREQRLSNPKCRTMPKPGRPPTRRSRAARRPSMAAQPDRAAGADGPTEASAFRDLDRCVPARNHRGVRRMAGAQERLEGARSRESRTASAGRETHICILFRRFTNFGRDITRDYVRALKPARSRICWLVRNRFTAAKKWKRCAPR